VQLLDMMHQLILMPTSGTAGEEAWTLLLQTIKDIRGLKRTEKIDMKEAKVRARARERARERSERVSEASA
jgi:hypothetical protein